MPDKIIKILYVILAIGGIIAAIGSFITHSHLLEALALALLGVSLILNGYATYLRLKHKISFFYICIGVIAIIWATLIYH
ncbi:MULTISPECIES: hypothetical protein [Priestia]|uniref:hypothetical protein n=1 Tax=Priestia TaxID=2800373 RepID=UPI0007624D6F|nr:hypothetical protein [Priestia megaterium]KWU60980.1 hypothetical protein AWX17_19330 [Priestia megaterium]MCE4092753.1 hypothetical protein [Priestia megaterium]